MVQKSRRGAPAARPSARGQDFETIPVPGRKIPLFVVDDRIDADACDELFQAYARLPYAFIDTDRDATSEIKHLVHRFEPERLKDNWLVTPIVELTDTLMRETGLAHRGLERVYANFNLFGDFQLAHDDGHCWTALVYLNARWEDDWGGETLFYPPNTAHAIAVPPKPGRIVVFDGEILHRGGVPSKLCIGPRITLAVKYQR